MKLRNLAIVLSAIALLAGCGDTPTPEPENILQSIEINTVNAKTEYEEGERIVPDRLIIICNWTRGVINVQYEECPDEFKFLPSLDTPLSTTDKSVTVTYKQKSASYTISVESAAEQYTADFTEKHTKVDNIPSQGNSSDNDMKEILNKYYFTNDAIKISSSTGNYYQINNGFNVTKTRNVPQMLTLGSRKSDVNVTIKFTKTIKTISFVCEPYSKYDTYHDAQNVDYETYLEVNGTKTVIPPHQVADVEEIKSLDYTVNSDTVNIKCPNTNVDEGTVANRIMVYGIVVTYL